MAWKLAGGRWATVEATVRVRDGVVWAKDFTARISHREDYALIAATATVAHFRLGEARQSHPHLIFGRPGGCEICQERWAYVTPYANTTELHDAFAFDLSCIGTRLRTCTDMDQIVPIAARAVDGGVSEDPIAPDFSLANLRSLARDAERVAIVEIGHKVPGKLNASQNEATIDYKILDVLKDRYNSRSRRRDYYVPSETRLPFLGTHLITFWSDDYRYPIAAPISVENLRETHQGIAEDAADIPTLR